MRRVVGVLACGCCRTPSPCISIRKCLEHATKDRDSRVGVGMYTRQHHLSSTAHEQRGVNLGGPPSKATYTQRPIAKSTVRER